MYFALSTIQRDFVPKLRLLLDWQIRASQKSFTILAPEASFDGRVTIASAAASAVDSITSERRQTLRRRRRETLRRCRSPTTTLVTSTSRACAVWWTSFTWWVDSWRRSTLTSAGIIWQSGSTWRSSGLTGWAGWFSSLTSTRKFWRIQRRWRNCTTEFAASCRHRRI